MKVLFMGTPTYAILTLRALEDAEHDIVAVYTKPDSRSGRGRHKFVPPLKEYALLKGIPVKQPHKLLDESEDVDEIVGSDADVIIVAAYGIILPPKVISGPTLGCLNVHPSLLPKYRGPSPVASAILNDDATVGVSIMLLDEGIDTGPILVQQEIQVSRNENCQELTQRLFASGAKLMPDTLVKWAQGSIVPVEQDHNYASITKHLKKSGSEIDWKDDAQNISLAVRAYYPWPGKHTFYAGKILKIIEADYSPNSTLDPGVIDTSDVVSVGTGAGKLILTKVQIEGKAIMSGREFANGQHGINGSVLGDK